MVYRRNYQRCCSTLQQCAGWVSSGTLFARVYPSHDWLARWRPRSQIQWKTHKGSEYQRCKNKSSGRSWALQRTVDDIGCGGQRPDRPIIACFMVGFPIERSRNRAGIRRTLPESLSLVKGRMAQARDGGSWQRRGHGGMGNWSDNKCPQSFNDRKRVRRRWAILSSLCNYKRSWLQNIDWSPSTFNCGNDKV